MPRYQQQTLRYRIVPSPIGDLGLVASSLGLTDVCLAPKRDLRTLSQTTTLKKARSAREYEEDPASPELRLDRAEKQLAEYFDGSRRNFALVLDVNPHPPSDSSYSDKTAKPDFTSAAQLALLEIPYGETASYGKVAAMAGSPRAARAVGSACAKNRLPLILPCHRVVRSDGSVGHYGGGSDVKVWLLELESRTPSGHRSPLQRFFTK